MALVEINLRKPAFLEEVVDEDGGGSDAHGRASRMSRPSGGTGNGGSMLRKVAIVGLVVAAVGIVRAIASRRESASSGEESTVVEVPIEGDSSERSGGRTGRRVFGIVLAVLGAVVLARQLRGRSRQ